MLKKHFVNQNKEIDHFRFGRRPCSGFKKRYRQESELSTRARSNDRKLAKDDLLQSLEVLTRRPYGCQGNVDERLMSRLQISQITDFERDCG